MRAIGIAIPFFRRRSGVPIDAQAQVHFNRVIADGGVVPAGLGGVNSFFQVVKEVYGTSDINTAISAAYDAHYLGYKLGAGSGTTLGQAAQTLYSCSGASADVRQTTAASQPLLLAHTGENYWFGSGVTNNFVSTPNAAANQITGDIEIVAKISIYDTSFYNVIIAKDDTVNRSYALSVSNSGFAVMTLKIGSAAAADFTSSISCGFSANTINWLKATRKESDGSINFYKSTDGITYTKIGTTISSTSGLLNNSSAVVSVNSQGVNNCSKIKIYQATIANTISPTPLTSNSTPVVDFNPASYNPSVSQTQWTSATGEVWSLNVGTATSGYKGVLVDRTIVQGDGVDDTFGGISINIQTVYNARRLFTNSGSGAIAHLYTNSTRYLERRVNGFSIFNGTYLNSLLANNINLNYIMGQYNSSNSIISVNNSADIVGNSGSTAPSGTFNVFNVGNHTLNTFVCTNALDAALQRTAMYNYIRSINGNSF